MKKAVFLDRDGVLNEEVDVLRDVKQLRVIPGVAKALQKINKLGFLAIVVTNQPVIARGWLTEKEVEAINQVLVSRLAKKGGKIDAVYYCPHHPNANLKKYRLQCRCRKPNIGMVKKAAKEFSIDLKKSFMVGDTMPDIVMGKRAKLTTVLVKTGGPKNDRGYSAKPDFVAKNLGEAVKFIQKWQTK